MGANVMRKFSWPFLGLVLASPVLMHCSSLPAATGPEGLGVCPDVTNVDAVARFDWEDRFGLDAESAGKLKGGVTAAINLNELAAQIDGDLKLACGNLANDLGATGDFESGKSACEAAVKAMGDVKGKLGENAKIALDVTPPKCAISLDALTNCVAACDASLSGGKAEVRCEGGELSGVCDGRCRGSCQLDAAAACSGTCQGSCDAQFKGTCTGTCDGTCDGKKVNGECKGTCEGRCESGASGECKGQCSGICELAAGGTCDGTCSGSCSVSVKEPACTGELKAPKVSADCKASCEARLFLKPKCSPAQVRLMIEDAADAEAAARYKAAIEKNLPTILRVAVGMKERVVGVATNVAGVVQGAQTVVATAKSEGPLMAAALTACVATPFTGAIGAVASIKANVDVSVQVNASVSASGSASGQAG